MIKIIGYLGWKWADICDSRWLSCTINSDCSDAAVIYFDSGCAAHNSCLV